MPESTTRKAGPLDGAELGIIPTPPELEAERPCIDCLTPASCVQGGPCPARMAEDAAAEKALDISGTLRATCQRLRRELANEQDLRLRAERERDELRRQFEASAADGTYVITQLGRRADRADELAVLLASARARIAELEAAAGAAQSGATFTDENDGSTTSGGTRTTSAGADAGDGPRGPAVGALPAADADELAGAPAADEPPRLVRGSAAPGVAARDRRRGLRARVSRALERGQRDAR